MTNYRNEETRLGKLEERLAAIEARIDALASGRPTTLHERLVPVWREALTPGPLGVPGRPSPGEASDGLPSS
jgi:hypothetical protein